MKYLVFSDLHGDVNCLNKILEEFKKNNCDEFIFLGDLLYHGPRNDLPSGYAPKKVVELLKPYNEKLIWIQGNCDAEVDTMVMGKEYLVQKRMDIGGRHFILTHGHHLSSKEPNDMYQGSIIMYGHYHVFEHTIINGVSYLNIGSTSIPKDGKKQYAIIDDEYITVYDFDNNIIFKSLIKDL